MRENQNAMPISAEEKETSPARGALLCVADAGLAEELLRELNLCLHVGSVYLATNSPDSVSSLLRRVKNAKCAWMSFSDQAR